MKKIFLPVILSIIFSINATFAEKIPYPENLDTTTEGASAAPAEINHKNSIYFTENDFSVK